MTAEVDRATTWVHVEFYITAWDDVTGPFYEALVRAVERGVDGPAAVRPPRVTRHPRLQGVHGQRLDATGIEWHPMLPIQPLKGEWRRPDLRNHRKILVVDGTVAFTGSQNLIEPGYNKPKNHEPGREWVELVARVEGPAVSALNLLFATDWYSETGVKLTEEIGTAPPPAGEIEGAGDPERAGLRDREQPARVHDAALLGATPALDHQPLLRARRVPAVRHHHGRPARRRRRAVRERGR